MTPRLQEDGSVILGAGAYGPDGVMGDGVEVVHPGDPRHAALLEVAVPVGEDPATWVPPAASGEG